MRCPSCARAVVNRPSEFTSAFSRRSFDSPARSGTPQFGRRSFATKRPLRPLSFSELVQRQKEVEIQQEEEKRAKEELERSIQNEQARSQPHISAFRPTPGSRRYIRAIYRHKLGLDDRSYPFPENIQPVGGLRKKKRVSFKIGNRFLLARYLDERYKRLIESEKASKRLDTYIKRTALNITKRRYMDEKQMEFDRDLILNWKEGDDTFLLPVTTADIIKNTKKTVILKKSSPTSTSIKMAAQLLQDDCIVAFPTETVYGLGANALSSAAVQKIYKAKNRPSDNPLISHFGSTQQLEAFTQIPEIYLPLIETFWPGPLSILLPVKPEMGISPLVTAGLDTLAVRIPSSPLARALILESNVPVAAPSANASTRPSPTLADHVRADLDGRIPLILSADEDPGTQCDVGLESTVVDGLSEPPTILRLGGVSLESIRALGGIWRDTVIYQKPDSKTTTSAAAATTTTTTNGISVEEEEFKPRTPGMKYRHYSPRCPVYVFKAGSVQPETPSKFLPPSDAVGRKVAVLCTQRWEPKLDPGAEVNFNWLGEKDEEVARNLFKCIREMDEWGAEVIIVEGVDEVGIGRSVMERLRKMSGGIIEE